MLKSAETMAFSDVSIVEKNTIELYCTQLYQIEEHSTKKEALTFIQLSGAG